MKIIKGLPASSGRAVGQVFRIKHQSFVKSGENNTNIQTETEIQHFHDAYSFVKDKISLYAKENDIFAAHLEILEDISIRVTQCIKIEKTDAVSAVEKTCTEICDMFADIEDEYLRSRSDDINDIYKQLILALTKNNNNPFSQMPEGSIILADNMLPSDTFLIDLSKLAGIALKKGNTTSHMAILANDNNIPLILRAGDDLDNIQDGETIVIDGDKGEIYTNPDDFLISEVKQSRICKNEIDSSPAVTKDDIGITVLANAGSLAEVERAISNGADGIGLLRTEFIFMKGDDFPTEEEQYTIYSECARICRGKILTIRTLDIGADKQLPYYSMEKEENPVLGLRGIRFSLSSPDILKAQLKAILRTSVSGNIRLMFPMITSVNEYNSACDILDECKTELRSEKAIFDEFLRAGIMIETPASVLLADDLAQTAAFFSIGTNDLTQYILAVDRNNPYSEYAYDIFHPAVVKSISQIVSSSEKYGIELSVCGKMASDINATELLLKLGIRKLSVAINSISLIKKQIRNQFISSCNS